MQSEMQTMRSGGCAESWRKLTRWKQSSKPSNEFETRLKHTATVSTSSPTGSIVHELAPTVPEALVGDDPIMAVWKTSAALPQTWRLGCNANASVGKPAVERPIPLKHDHGETGTDNPLLNPDTVAFPFLSYHDISFVSANAEMEASRLVMTRIL
jgi:hypothetical protein